MGRRSKWLAAFLVVAFVGSVTAVQPAGASASSFDFHIGGGTPTKTDKTLKAANAAAAYKVEPVGEPGFVLECTDATVGSSEIVVGSPGESFFKLTFTGCKAWYKSKACTGVTAGTEILQGKQAEVVTPESIKGQIATYFVSTEPSEVILNASGTCDGVARKLALTGILVVQYSTEETETKEHGLRFPTEPTIESVEDSSHTVMSVGLYEGKQKFSIAGETFLKLESGKVWGVF